jgi:hypothetical protein
MYVLFARAELLTRQARWREAETLYQRAIPILERAQTTSEEFTRALTNRERGLLELHRSARGLAALERLASKPDDLRPDLRVDVEFILARSLWESGGDRARARELAGHALIGARSLDGKHPDLLAGIERWLAGHPAR